ncbi:unnamed protein product [Soboliphyme baturini]|uniref:ORC4_C domain-containing protein n=1 Tax=Soboliphyme baturini TaxID=241478 RepID=A0A183J712_9BILA|nr:unnamed protein product [Soboliphyme baturini]
MLSIDAPVEILKGLSCLEICLLSAAFVVLRIHGDSQNLNFNRIYEEYRGFATRKMRTVLLPKDVAMKVMLARNESRRIAAVKRTHQTVGMVECIESHYTMLPLLFTGQ